MPGYPQLLRDALHLARRGAGGVNLGHRRHDRAVDALVALDHVLGEESPRPQLRHPHRDVADARDQVALAVAVAAVGAFRAQLIGLGVHDRVLLGEPFTGNASSPTSSYSQAHLLCVESFMPSSSDRSLTVISPDRTPLPPRP